MVPAGNECHPGVTIISGSPIRLLSSPLGQAKCLHKQRCTYGLYAWSSTTQTGICDAQPFADQILPNRFPGLATFIAGVQVSPPVGITGWTNLLTLGREGNNPRSHHADRHPTTEDWGMRSVAGRTAIRERHGVFADWRFLPPAVRSPPGAARGHHSHRWHPRRLNSSSTAP